MLGSRSKSIKTRLLIPTLAAVLIFVSAFSLFWSQRYSSALTSGFEAGVDMLQQLSVRPLGNAVWAFDEELAKTTLSALEVADGFDFAVVLSGGQPFAVHMVDAPEETQLTERLQSIVDRMVDEDLQTLEYSDFVLRRADIVAEGDVVGELIFGISAKYISAATFDAAIGSAIMGGVAFLIFSLILVLVSRVVTSPLSGIVEKMSALLEERTDFQVPEADRRDEFGLVGRAIQTSRDNLKETLARAEQEKEKKEEQALIIHHLRRSFKALSSGDFSEKILVAFPEEYADLKEGLNQTVDKLNDLVGSIVVASQQLQDRAEDVNASSSELEERTTKQAQTLTQTSVAIKDLTGTVTETANGALNAKSYVQGTSNDAIETGQVVQCAVDAMKEIEESSAAITKIVTVIDDIAFQTNLLALNAGVEAARAGESGRGFAVVASEVRGLAQRSADAAKEIKQLINTSSNHVGDGVTHVKDAGNALNAIVESVGELSEHVGQISTAMDRQTQSLSQVNTGMSELDDVTQRYSKMVEQSAKAGRQLKEEATQLQDLVSQFKLVDKQAPKTDYAAA